MQNIQFWITTEQVWTIFVPVFMAQDYMKCPNDSSGCPSDTHFLWNNIGTN